MKIQNDIKISVIVAAYNAEKYIDECLQSLINQTLKDIEIICINDGSTDTTHSILQKYSLLDTRIILINKSNEQNPAKARNKALSHVKGEYITTVDSDDFVELDYLEKLYNRALITKAEAVVSNLIIHFENIDDIEFSIASEELLSGQVITGKEAMILSLNGSGLHSCVLWHHTLFYKYQFDERGAFGDEFSMCELYAKCLKVAYVNTKYFYRRNSLSITQRKTNVKIQRLLLYRSLSILLKENAIPLSFMDETFWVEMKRNTQYYFRTYSSFDEKQKSESIKIMRSFFDFLDKKIINRIYKDRLLLMVFNKMLISNWYFFLICMWIQTKLLRHKC